MISLAVCIKIQFNLTFAVVRLSLFSCQWKSVALQLWNFLRRLSLELEWCLCLEACRHPLILSFSYDQKVILSYHLTLFQHNYLVFRPNWISFASFTHMFLRSNESLQSFPVQNNPPQCKTILEFSIFEFFSRPSVALSTEIEFPLGTTSFYLAAWCCCALKWTLMGFTLQNISHSIVYVWTYCEPTVLSSEL